MSFRVFFRRNKEYDFLIEAINQYIYGVNNILSILEKDDVVKSKIKNKKSLILYYDGLKSIRTGRTIYEILYKHRIINKTLFNKINCLLIYGSKHESCLILLNNLKSYKN